MKIGASRRWTEEENNLTISPPPPPSSSSRISSIKPAVAKAVGLCACVISSPDPAAKLSLGSTESPAVSL